MHTALWLVADRKPSQWFNIKKQCWRQHSVAIFKILVILKYLHSWKAVPCPDLPVELVTRVMWQHRAAPLVQLSLLQEHPLLCPATSHLPRVSSAIWRQKDQRDLNTLQKAIFPLLKAALYSTYVWLGLNCPNICRLWIFYAKPITFDKMKEWCFLVLLFCCSGGWEYDIGAIN